jgi:hypothetical protein
LLWPPAWEPSAQEPPPGPSAPASQGAAPAADGSPKCLVNKNKNKMYQIMSYALKTRVYENQRISLPKIRNQRCPSETWRKKNYLPSPFPFEDDELWWNIYNFLKKD